MKTARRPRYRIHDEARGMHDAGSGRSTIVRRVPTHTATTHDEEPSCSMCGNDGFVVFGLGQGREGPNAFEADGRTVSCVDQATVATVNAATSRPVLENIDPTFRADNRVAEVQRRNAAFWKARPNAMRVPLNEGDGDYDAYLATTQDLPSPIGLRGGL